MDRNLRSNSTLSNNAVSISKDFLLSVFYVKIHYVENDLTWNECSSGTFTGKDANFKKREKLCHLGRLFQRKLLKFEMKN